MSEEGNLSHFDLKSHHCVHAQPTSITNMSVYTMHLCKVQIFVHWVYAMYVFMFYCDQWFFSPNGVKWNSKYSSPDDRFQCNIPTWSRVWSWREQVRAADDHPTERHPVKTKHAVLQFSASLTMNTLLGLKLIFQDDTDSHAISTRLKILSTTFWQLVP